jgi:uncharacterized membrane protein
MDDQESHRAQATFGPAEIGALAHLYRGEMYQSKVWRNRLDTTTNWAVIITGIALSVTFSNADSSPIPILLVSWVVIVFLLFEARRYLYYDVFRVRVRVMEINFYGPILKGQGMHIDNHWNDLLAEDYSDLRFHISFIEAVGRRIRRTYGWIFAALLVCYLAKIFVHPTPLCFVARVVGARRHRPDPRRSRPRRWSAVSRHVDRRRSAHSRIAEGGRPATQADRTGLAA